MVAYGIIFWLIKKDLMPKHKDKICKNKKKLKNKIIIWSGIVLNLRYACIMNITKSFGCV